MTAFLTSLIFVVLAEMGDKTQLLAMAFATRFKWQTVMWGVLAATIFNHLFAVIVGAYLTHFIPMSYIQIAAAISFIIFGLWTIRGMSSTAKIKAVSTTHFGQWPLLFSLPKWVTKPS